MAQVRQQIDHSGLRKSVDGDWSTKAWQRRAGVGIESSQEECRADDVNHALAIDFGIGDALAVVLTHGVFPAEGVRFTVGPNGLTTLRIHRDHVTTRTGDSKELAVHITGR